MCIFEGLSAPQSSAKPIIIEYEIHVCKQEEYIDIDAISAKAFNETVRSPPAYEEKPRSIVTVSSSRAKGNLFTRIFGRKSKKATRIAQDLPSYREAELTEAWAKVGIDINNRKQGPRPHCTPEELISALDGLFGARPMPKAA